MANFRTNHKRLVCIMDMIEKCDSMISAYRILIDKYDDVFWRNSHIKLINRYVGIRKRLYAYYADVWIKTNESIIAHQIQSS